MKIAIYTIAKNESQFVERWADTTKSADVRLILDTGSTDDTIDKARAAGITVEQAHIKPWRFDVARNRSLAMLPADVDWCMALDMDEVIVTPDWRKRLEWEIRREPAATRFSYPFWWNANAPTKPKVIFNSQKIHRREGYRWKHPVHEVLESIGPEKLVVASTIHVDHHADNSKPRSDYLPLLKLSVEEDSHDDRNAHYYGRELFFYGRYDEAIAELKRHLALPRAKWDAERSASCRFIAKCYVEKREPWNAEPWFVQATQEYPGSRFPWFELAKFYSDEKIWVDCVKAFRSMFTINDRDLNYMATDEPWGVAPYDLGSVAAYYAGDIEQASAWLKKAVEMNPSDQRLKNNGKFIFA